MTVRVRVTVEAGGYGMAGEGMTPELLGALRAAGFEGWPDRNVMARVTDVELPPGAVAALAASWMGGVPA